MDQKKLNSFFQHPVVIKRTKQIINPSPQLHIQPEEQEKISQQIKNAKKFEIKRKIAYLQNLRITNKTLNSQIKHFEANFNIIEAQQKEHIIRLQNKLQQLNTDIQNCHEVEKIEALQFLQWRNRDIADNHKKIIEELEQKYKIELQNKILEINKIKVQINDITNNIQKLQALISEQENIILPPSFTQIENIVIPNLQIKRAQLGNLRKKIESLKQNKRLLINEIKLQLNPNTWKVKNIFECSKEKISKQIEKLLIYIQKPTQRENLYNKIAQKIPNTDNLIQNYQNKLQMMQQSLPYELKTQQILKCLKPLPWRSIKGIQSQTVSLSRSKDHYTRLQKQYKQLQAKNAEYRAQLNKLQNDIIEKYNKKIQEFDSHLKVHSQYKIEYKN